MIDHPKYFFLDRYNDSYVEEINQFAKAILEKGPLSCSGEDGYQAELSALAARLSWKEKRPFLYLNWKLFQRSDISISHYLNIIK